MLGFVVYHVLIHGFNISVYLFLNLKKLIEDYFLKIEPIILIKDIGVVVNSILNWVDVSIVHDYQDLLRDLRGKG